MHFYANPKKFNSIARPATTILNILGVGTLAVGSIAGLFFTPPDYLQGETVRIMYVHVPTAWLGMAGWSIIAMSSLMFLVWKHPLAALAAKAAAAPGAVFTAICLITGSIWGRPTWGTWWEWDGRLTSMLILLFMYLAYLALGSADKSNDRVLAVFGLIGTVNLPIIHGSVIWWNSLHQPPSLSLRGSAISGSILWPLGFTMTGFTALFGAIVLMRMRSMLAKNKLEARMRRMAD
jgi:heme exporter protein C